MDVPLYAIPAIAVLMIVVIIILVVWVSSFSRRPRPPQKYRGHFGKTARSRCPHVRLEAIYGEDSIKEHKGYLLFCLDCRRGIDGPTRLARNRMPEWIGG